MITLRQALDIHEALIEQFGGSRGVRDQNALTAALERPFSGFGEIEFYPNPQEKAAAILESIVNNHPFIDGNKRTGYVLMRLILMLLGKDIHAGQLEKYEMVMSVASGEMRFNDIVSWIEKRMIENLGTESA